MDHRLLSAIENGKLLAEQDLIKRNSYSEKEKERAQKWINNKLFNLIIDAVRGGNHNLFLGSKDITFGIFNRVKFSALIGELNKIDGIKAIEQASAFRNIRYLSVYWD